jgi:UDP-N-acetyl-2-amino-2-deoxyglucuronate dehydrogenase
MNPIGTAIIGPGKVAHTHAQALATIQGSRFVAVGGRTPPRTQAFADQYGVAAYTDLHELLHDPAVDAIIICTPHPQHAAQAIAALEAGMHVLVEKPLATTVADCDRMIAAARANNVTLGVISQRRLYAPVRRMKNAIDAGKIGKPVLATVSVLGWRSAEYYAMDPWRGTWDGEGGGVLVNQAVHQLDLLCWLMGPVAEVFGYHANLNHPTIEVEDTAIAVVRFANGALGSIVASNSQNPGLYGNVHIHGSNGASVGVQTEGGSMFIAGVTTEVDPPINDLWTIAGEADLLPQWQAEDRVLARRIDIMQGYHQQQIADFVDAIRDGRAPLVTGEDGRAAVALFEAIYRSQREGRPIAIAPIDQSA